MKRQDAMLASLGNEVQQARVQEQRGFVQQEMLLCQSTSDRRFAVAMTNKKKREAEDSFHRNTVHLGSAPCYRTKKHGETVENIQT